MYFLLDGFCLQVDLFTGLILNAAPGLKEKRTTAPCGVSLSLELMKLRKLTPGLYVYNRLLYMH